MTFSIPISLDLSMMVLRAGIMTSQPSRPNRFSEDHFRARKSSNLLGEGRWERMESVGPAGAGGWGSPSPGLGAGCPEHTEPQNPPPLAHSSSCPAHQAAHTNTEPQSEGGQSSLTHCREDPARPPPSALQLHDFNQPPPFQTISSPHSPHAHLIPPCPKLFSSALLPASVLP